MQIVAVVVAAMLSATADASGDGPTNTTQHKSKALILGIVCGAIAFIVLIVCCCLRRIRMSTSGLLPTKTNVGVVSHIAESIVQYAELLALKLHASDIEDVQTLNQGMSFDVWLVKYKKTQLLVAKRLHDTGDGIAPQQADKLIREIKLVATLKHPNIVTFVGAAWTKETDLQALFAYMDRGDLRAYLANTQTPREWTPAKLQIAIDVAEALVYVHALDPPVVHRDLTTHNVMLQAQSDGTLHATVRGFGVSDLFLADSTTLPSGGCYDRWLVPEVVRAGERYDYADYTPAADIFSFGAVLSEMDSHALPYDANGSKVPPHELLQWIAKGDQRPPFQSRSCPLALVALGDRCVAFDPVTRPTATEIVRQLKQIQQSLVATT